MKKHIKIIIILITILIFHVTNTVIGKNNVLPFYKGEVIIEVLNVRQGTGTEFKIIDTLKKGDIVDVLAQKENWYIVQAQNGCIGCVYKEYIKQYIPKEDTISTTVLTQDEETIFQYINQQRGKEKMPPLQMNEELQNIARIKARDLVSNKYFSHYSPVLGTIENMLDEQSVIYQEVKENIVGTTSSKKAVAEWMNSTDHKKYILDETFTHTGIGVAGGSKYGTIYVQLFIK